MIATWSAPVPVAVGPHAEDACSVGSEVSTSNATREVSAIDSAVRAPRTWPLCHSFIHSMRAATVVTGSPSRAPTAISPAAHHLAVVATISPMTPTGEDPRAA